ncbi:triacylglycerol lipase-like protein [Lophium mytilinum]|uniref:Carboxylic ester hydrolase n=1 Tax=Lophium mytilinum TaxID=390894 RepID=A0A6A6QYQ2_9PEZI|nr:triacylglycerol lipase-like protein [Lophium mytilinum]
MRSLLLLAAFAASGALGVDTLVDLGYSKYKGEEQDDGITHWIGLRYADQVTGENGLRFAAPRDPPSTKGIVDANKYGPVCLGTSFNLTDQNTDKESEDCLFANVFAPTNASTSNLLPVYVFIQGGGFNANANSNYNGSELIRAADMGMVFVNFNYRVGPYGFLASQKIAGNKSLSLNNGLKDQRQLLKWVQDHISKFGGDPNHVVLGGASAGAGSVVLQLTAYGGSDANLFHAAAGESQSFPALRDVKDSEFMYRELLKQAHCKTLACLQTMDAPAFQQAVKKVKIAFPGGRNPPIYLWGPTLDYDFVKDYTYNEIANGHFVKVPTIFGDDTNDGLSFTPKTITTQTESDDFVRSQFPSLTDKDLDKLRTVFTGTNGWREQAGDLYGSIRYLCPGLNMTSAYAKANQNAWNYHWNVGTAGHVSEIGPLFWGDKTIAGKTEPGQYIHQYWASFIRTYNPNNYSGYVYKNQKKQTFTWEQSKGAYGQRILFDNAVVKMEDVPAIEKQKCALIDSIGITLVQ